VSEVELVLITAEPGEPLSDEMYDEQTPLAMLARTCSQTYGVLALAPSWHDRNLIFHRNLRLVLDLCWPDTTLDEQLRRTWIVDSYLCSAPVESGPVVRPSWEACARDYLRPQLELFADATVVALGAKAQQRAKRYVQHLVPAYSVAPPGAFRREARTTWEDAAAHVRRARSV
jgi:hypothetical protein